MIKIGGAGVMSLENRLFLIFLERLIRRDDVFPINLDLKKEKAGEFAVEASEMALEAMRSRMRWMANRTK